SSAAAWSGWWAPTRARRPGRPRSSWSRSRADRYSYAWSWPFLRVCGSIGRSWRDKVASWVRRRKASRRHRRRDVWQRLREEPHQEQYHREMHEELHGRVADEVACAHAQQPEERQHPERVDEVRQGFRGVVNLHHPAEVHLQLVRGLKQIWRFDHPFAPARGYEQAEHGRVDRHQDRIAVRVRDADEQPGEPL